MHFKAHSTHLHEVTTYNTYKYAKPTYPHPSLRSVSASGTSFKIGSIYPSIWRNGG